MRLLIEHRKGQGLTQQQLGDRLGRPQSYIGKIETGERRMDVVEFAEWARALKVEPSPIIGAIMAALDPGA